MNNKKERRKNYPMDEQEMYNLSPIDQFIEKERRHDELDRLNEVIQQKRVWLTVVGLSLCINLVFVIIVLLGE